MNLPFWTTIAYSKDRKDPIAGWKEFFGGRFEAIRPFLVPCPGEYARRYPHPDYGMLCVRRIEDSWVAYTDPDLECYGEDVELSEADVLLYRLDVAGFQERLRSALGIDGPSSAVGPDLVCLGTCTRGPKRRRVYWVQSREDAAAMAGAHEVITRSDAEGCAVVTSLGEAVDRMLGAAGVSGVDLNERITPTPGGFEGGCGIACRHLTPRDLPVRDLKDHLDTRLDTLAERVVALNQENETLKQNLARVLTEFARRVDPEFLALVFVILAAGSMRAAAKALKLPKSTLDDRLKQYVGRGGVYQLLFSTLDLRRKGLGQEPIESFNDLFIRHQPQGAAPGPDLWRELLDGLQALNGDNWQQIRAELVDLLQTENPDT
jgi:hypothetical protein